MTQSQQTDLILHSLENGVGWVVFNRPDFRNAISQDMWNDIPRRLEALVKGGAKVIVFRGQGGAFASGADLYELAEITNESEASELWNAIRDALNAVASVSVPTIAMIKGPCMGGGCLLAAACDLRYADPGSRFSIPVAQLGLTLDEDNLARVMALVGPGVARELLFTGATISAERAERVGLLNMMVPASELSSVVNNTAEQIIRNSSVAVSQLKSSLIRICDGGSHNEDQTSVINSYLTDDFRARVSRALESIRPQ